MDIAALSMNLSQMKIANQASISVLKMAMDTTKNQLTDFANDMEKSVFPNLGGSIDIKG